MLCAEKVSFYFCSLCQTGLIWLFASSTLALLSFGAPLSVKKWCCPLVRLPVCNTVFPWIAGISMPEMLCFNSGCLWSVYVFKRMPFPFQIVCFFPLVPSDERSGFFSCHWLHYSEIIHSTSL